MDRPRIVATTVRSHPERGAFESNPSRTAQVAQVERFLLPHSILRVDFCRVLNLAASNHGFPPRWTGLYSEGRELHIGGTRLNGPRLAGANLAHPPSLSVDRTGRVTLGC